MGLTEEDVTYEWKQYPKTGYGFIFYMDETEISI